MPRADMRIRIRRDAATRSGYRFNWSEFGMPSLAIFKQCLTQEQRRLNSTYTWSSWTTQQAAIWYMIHQHYTCQQMADLLGKATLLDRTAEVGTCAIMGEDFSRHANPFDSCYLNMGGSMFKLQPVAIADVTQPLRLMRERVQQETQATRDEILAAAGREAGIITNAAEETRVRVEHELQATERDRGISLPAWMRHADHLPIMFHDNYSFPIEIGIRLDFTIGVFFFIHGETIYEWDNIHPTRIRPLIWMKMHPITGRYNLEAARLDTSYPGDLPHMSHTQACLAPTGLPEHIGNQDDLFRLRGAIGRCYTRIHMNSLLCSPDTWSHEVRRSTPDAVLTFWRESNHGHDIPRNDAGEVDPAYFHADRVVSTTEERRATWELERLDRPTGRTTGEQRLEEHRAEIVAGGIGRLDVATAQTVPPLTPEQTAAAVDENEANETEGEEERDDGTV
ncbi:hypothetical protein LCGC14_1773690 [marine sediment metagenome]|uniref:Uncharacterized protein n=1 Tax=marine sediment metagenome TaxID=412755 RepID=A0A0F9JX67_9ZZZZ